jgi:ATP-dependent Clp protease ATP-binding subunit ClpB
MLAELKDSLAARGLTLTWEASVREYLVKKAYSVTYGARNLRRTIQRDLEDPISEKIIDSFEAPIESIHICVEADAVRVEAK